LINNGDSPHEKTNCFCDRVALRSRCELAKCQRVGGIFKGGAATVSNDAHVSVGPLQDQTHRKLVNRTFHFQKRSQYFIGSHDESLSLAMRVHDPHRLAFGSQSYKSQSSR
jgi:hypothetical protein